MKHPQRAMFCFNGFILIIFWNYNTIKTFLEIYTIRFINVVELIELQKE
jgi:hypothetical protein